MTLPDEVLGQTKNRWEVGIAHTDRHALRKRLRFDIFIELNTVRVHDRDRGVGLDCGLHAPEAETAARQGIQPNERIVQIELARHRFRKRLEELDQRVAVISRRVLVSVGLFVVGDARTVVQMVRGAVAVLVGVAGSA